MIVAISGKIGSGKSHISKHIRTELPNLDFKNKSFGYDVKKIVSYLTGINMKTILSRKAKSIFLSEWNMTIGEMFQKVGTDCMRDNLHNNTWVLSMFSKYDDGLNWVIDDVRFRNEANYIKERGGIIIRLEGDPKNVRAFDKRDPNHKSEIELDNYEKFDIIWENTLEKPLDDLIQLIEHKINIFDISDSNK